LRRVKAPLLALLAALAVPATAGAQALQMTASTERTGHVDLALQGPPAAQVDVTEGARRVATVTLDATGRGGVRNAGEWRCDRRRRTFSAAGDGLDATTTVTTPSCAHRYRLVVRPRRPRAGHRVRVRVVDTFRLGDVHARVCARGPGRRKCHRAPARLRLKHAGRWRLTVHATQRRIRVRPPRHIRLLATGDSMIQIIDSFLAQRLEPRGDRVHSDAHISSGISKPFFFDWPHHARVETARYHPDVTIMFLGANDGFPLGGTPCCGRTWRHKYARVARRMMRTYARSGAVYWCLLPAPRDGSFRRVFVAVNRALRIAQRHTRAHLLDLPKTFTPGYRFRQSITWRGRTVSVRQDDGVHLNVAGASIAATLMIRRMARDGVL
jgi:lysophospholipase L1-like esterase